MARRGGAVWMMTAIAPLLASACTTALYKGPARPSSQIAVLTSQDTIVDKVDNLMVREHGVGNASRFEVLPGEHELGISLNRVTPGLFTTRVQRSGYIVVCVELEAGHVYRTRAIIRGSHWVPQIVDLKTHRQLDLDCEDEGEEPATPVAAAATAPTSAPAANALTPAGATEPEPDPTAEAAATPAAAPEAPARAAAARAANREEPPRRPTVRRAPPAAQSSPEAELSGRRPGSGLSLFFGLAFGGEDFVTASNSNGNRSTLTAGGGVIAGVNAMLTPVWAGETVGFGVGADASVKYDSIDASNGSASVTRFPIAFTAHMLTNGSGGNHYFLFRGGVTRDFGVSYQVSFTLLDTNIRGTWGPTGAIGYYKQSTDSFAWDVLAFAAFTSHVVGTEKIDASAFGLTMGFHLNL